MVISFVVWSDISRTGFEALKLLGILKALEVEKLVCRRSALVSKCGASARSLNCP